MGEKGDKLSNKGASAEAELMKKLATIDSITSKKMFGGYGIFHDGKMFGIVNSKGGIFFKVTDDNLEMYEKAESEKHSRMPYYSVPDKVLAKKAALVKWAKKSIEVSK